MVRKTDAIGNETMGLGSALAVFRYKEGYGGVQKLFTALDIESSPALTNAFIYPDRRRVMKSGFIYKEQTKRFQKKQQKSKATTTKLQNFSPGYKLGGYSAA